MYFSFAQVWSKYLWDNWLFWVCTYKSQWKVSEMISLIEYGLVPLVPHQLGLLKYFLDIFLGGSTEHTLWLIRSVLSQLHGRKMVHIVACILACEMRKNGVKWEGNASFSCLFVNKQSTLCHTINAEKATKGTIRQLRQKVLHQ